MVREERRIPRPDGAVSDARHGATSRHDVRLIRGCDGQAALTGFIENGARQHVLGAILGGGGQRQHFGLGTPHAHHFDHAEATFGNRAGLIEEDGIDLSGGLQHSAAAHQDATARQPVDGGYHGRGHRQNERAGAGDDQHCHGAQPIAGEIKGQSGDQQKCGQEVAREAVGKAFHGSVLFASMLHQLDDLRQRGLGGGARHSDAQRSQTVQRAGEDFVADALVARQRLAGDGAFVDAGGAMKDYAVSGQTFTGAHHHGFTGRQLGGIHFDHLCAIAENERAARNLLYKSLNGGMRTARGVAFQRLADEHDEHGFGRRQELTRDERRDHGHADGQIGRDLSL